MHRLIFSLFLWLLLPLHAQAGAPSHALTLFGAPKYSKNFTHFDYVNPEAPKGGAAKLADMSAFDSLNPFILKGLPAPGISVMFESLMTPSLDEPQSYYGLLAESVLLSDDKTTLTFRLNPRARWHDGTTITAEDVAFSFAMLTTKGDPTYRIMYRDIASAEALDARTVRFTFSNTESRELPILAASMPVFSKAYYSDPANDFEKSTLTPPMGSGPYKVQSLEGGRYIIYERVADYWGKDLPTRKGQFNFDTLRYDVYRDETVSLEALKAGEYDFREEYISRNWKTAYNIPAVEEGRLIKRMIPHKIPRGMQAFLFNVRKGKFADRRVREAISISMDFEWMNHALFFDAYLRSDSLFQNTDFAARQLPNEAEKALLEPFAQTLPPTVFSDVYHPPKTDGSGNHRAGLLRAQGLLDAAGWVIKDGQRVNAQTGEALTVEFMMRQRTFERVIAPMRKALKRLGIEARFRLVDDAQYQKRLENKDFDIISIWWNLGLHFPGNEQKSYWHSSQASIAGSRNLSGLQNPAVDAILDQLVDAKDYDALQTAARALDRVIMLEHMVIPHWYLSAFRAAYWDKFGLPKTMPSYGLGFHGWWLKEDK